MVETWHSREFPLLREIVDQVDRLPHTRVSAHDAGVALSMHDDDILRAIRRLRAGGYVEDINSIRRAGDGPIDLPLTVTEKALRAVDAWPTEQTALDRMIAALEAIAEHTDDPDERTTAQRFAGWLRAGATTVGLSVASAAITGQIPGA